MKDEMIFRYMGFNLSIDAYFNLYHYATANGYKDMSTALDDLLLKLKAGEPIVRL